MNLYEDLPSISSPCFSSLRIQSLQHRTPPLRSSFQRKILMQYLHFNSSTDQLLCRFQKNKDKRHPEDNSHSTTHQYISKGLCSQSMTNLVKTSSAMSLTVIRRTRSVIQQPHRGAHNPLSSGNKESRSRSYLCAHSNLIGKASQKSKSQESF